MPFIDRVAFCTPTLASVYFDEECEKDLTDMIRLSYNHPSVIMYSIGNEVYFKDVDAVSKISRKLTSLCKKLDPSRAVINALNPLMSVMGNSKNPTQGRDDVVNPRREGKGSALAGSQLVNTIISFLPLVTKLVGSEKGMRKRNAVLEPLDIVGFNYGDFLYEPQHQDYPNRVLCGSETFPAKIEKTWNKVKEMPWVVGDFLWTAWDYIGETGVGAVGYDEKVAFTQPFPTLTAGCANIDLTGLINCQGYYTAIVFGQYKKPHIAVHPVNHAGQKLYIGEWRMTDAVHSWSWHGLSGRKTQVDVYSGANTAELFQDGVSLGKKTVEHCMAVYDVVYRDGELRAVEYDKDGNALAEDVLRTAGKTMRLTVSPEKEQIQAGGSGLLYIPMELTDEDGIRMIMEERQIKIEVEGSATLLAVGNGALVNEDLQPYVGNTVRSHEGRALAILRSTEDEGEIKVTVTAEGLEPVVLSLSASF